MINKSFKLIIIIVSIISVCLGCQSKKSYKPQSKNSKKFYDLSVKEMKDFAKLRSHQIDKDFTKVTTQYLHFMNKYQNNYFFRHKNNFNFSVTEQGPIKGAYVASLTAVVYSKSGDFIQKTTLGGIYHLSMDYRSYYSNNDRERRYKYDWTEWFQSFMISPDCKKYYVKKEYNKIKDQCDQSNFQDISESEYFIQNVVPHMCLNIHKPNYEIEQQNLCEKLMNNINSSFAAFIYSYYLNKKNSDKYYIWFIGSTSNERIEDNMLHNSIFN